MHQALASANMESVSSLLLKILINGLHIEIMLLLLFLV